MRRTFFGVNTFGALVLGMSAWVTFAAPTPPRSKASLPTKPTANAPITHLTWQPLYEPGSGGAIVDIAVSPFDARRVLVAGDMLGIGLSTERGDSWESTLGFKTWEMASFTWHPTNPNVIWVGSMSGPYVSRDGGKTWTQKRQGMPAPAGYGYSVPIEKVLFDPHDTNHLLAIGGSSRHWDFTGDPMRGVIWESRDNGENWTRLSCIMPDGSTSTNLAETHGDNLTWAAYLPGSSTKLYAQGDKAGFLISQDGGKTWMTRNNGLPPAELGRVALHPTDDSTLWIGVNNYLPAGATQRVPGGIYKTTDGGLHWINSSAGLGQAVSGTDPNLTSRYRAVTVASSNPNVLYTNDWAYSTGTIYKSEDGGAHWRPVASKQNIGSDSNDPTKQRVFQLDTAAPAGLGLGGIAVDPHDANAAYGFNTESIARTLDGGRTWNDGTSYQPQGATGWRGRGYSGWVTTNFRFNPFKRGQSAWQGMDASRLWISDDNLQTWTRQLNDPDPWNGGRDVTFARDGHSYATTGTFNFTGIGRSADGGKTWQVLHGASHGLPDFYQGGAPGGIYALPDNGSKVWAVVNNRLLATTDGGEHWTPVLERPGLQWIAADPKTPTRFYVSGERNVYSTEDGTKFTPLGGPHVNGKMTVDTLGRLLVVAPQGTRAGLWRYDPAKPAESRWTRLCDETWMGDVSVNPANPKRIVFTTNQNSYTEISAATGVWISSDDGVSWSPQNEGLAMLRGNVAAFDPFDPTRLVFGTYGRGFFETHWPTMFAPLGTRRYTSTPDDARFAAVAEAPQPPAPTLRNADMSEGTDIPASWTEKWVGRGQIQVTRDTKIFHSAPASLSVATGGADAMGQASELIDATAGTTFTLSGWVRSQGQVKVNVGAQSFNGAYQAFEWQQVNYIENDHEWTHFQKNITLPANAAHLNVLLLIEGNGQAWLDDVQITAVQLPHVEP